MEKFIIQCIDNIKNKENDKLNNKLKMFFKSNQKGSNYYEYRLFYSKNNLYDTASENSNFEAIKICLIMTTITNGLLKIQDYSQQEEN